MNFDWLLLPITHYAALVIGLFGGVALFLSAKCEVAKLTRQVRSLSETVEQMKQAVKEPEPIAPPPVPTPDLSPSLNLTKRARALRMYKRGETAETIAASMRAPQNEIQLLLRVEQMLSARSMRPQPPAS
jgi:hypothetical protein